MERRKNPRYPVNVEAQVSMGMERLTGTVKDICRDAILVEVKREIPLGTELALALALPGTGGPLHVVGKVVRVAAVPGGQDVAVLFTDLMPAYAQRIDFFIALQGDQP
jgi:hypothetical protein